MLSQTIPTWEQRLLALAHEGLESHSPAEPFQAEAGLLEQAYEQCERITRQHSRTFYLASQLLPAEKRRAVRALYAFCRYSDDLVDRPIKKAEESLQAWRQRALSANPAHNDPIALAWADTRLRYHIPRRYAEQLIEGVGRDLAQTRYATFEELSAYCYGVASTVGLMSMHIIGFQGREALPYALKLGVALQLTNILRDVAEDWKKGRVYLPQDEMAAFGLTELDLEEQLSGQRTSISERWQYFLRFQIQRNRRLYAEAEPGIALLDPDGRFAIAAAAGLYQGILDDIESHHGDVFTRRAHLSAAQKLLRLPGIWRRSRHPFLRKPSFQGDTAEQRTGFVINR
jgi:phytoene synthase